MGAGDAVEQSGDVVRVRINLLESVRQEGTRQRALLQMGLLGQSRQPGCVLGIQCHIQSVCRSCHYPSLLHVPARFVYQSRRHTVANEGRYGVNLTVITSPSAIA